MSFPASYSLYQEVTIDHTKVSADLTDYVVYIDLANLVKAGADIFDTCRSDGGDIRATKSDGTTQLATELVAIDTTAKTGELHVKFTGTLSSSTDTIIRIWYNGTDTALSVSDTYGRNAVWSDYKSVWHFAESSGNTVDSTAGNTLTNYGVTYESAKIRNGAKLGTVSGNTNTLLSTSFAGAGMDWSTGQNKTISFWIKENATPGSSGANRILDLRTATKQSISSNLTYPSNKFNIQLGGTILFDYTTGFSTATWYRIDVICDSSNNATLYIGAVSKSTGTWINGGNDTSNTQINSANKISSAPHGTPTSIDELRFRQSAVTSTWISTEYNNQNSPSTFYSAGSEQGGGGGATFTPVVSWFM